MRYLITLFLASCLFKVSTAQIDCPPDKEIACYEVDGLLDKVVIEEDKFELIPEILTRESGCSNNIATLAYFLYDVVAEKKETTAACLQTVVIKAFDPSEVVWPPAEVSVNNIDDLPSLDQLITGLSPALDNACSFIYTYDDTYLNNAKPRKVIRRWTALDWCMATTYTYDQILIENRTTVNGLYIDVTNCGGRNLALDNIEIRINGVVADDNRCDYITFLGVLNCVVDNNMVDSDDDISISIVSEKNPLLGVNTIDLVRIQRHILGIETFVSPCSLWAADVNSDGQINGLDLVELLKLILGIYTELPQGHPVLYSLDGSPATQHNFKGSDFPLSRLQLIQVNKGNVLN